MSQESAATSDFVFERPRPRERARIIYKDFLLVRGYIPPVEFRNTPEWRLVSWEQALVDGRTSAVVNHLLLQEVTEISFRSTGHSWRCGPGGSRLVHQYLRNEFVTYDEVNHLINLHLDEFSDWSPALAAYQAVHLAQPVVSIPASRPPLSPLPAQRQHVLIPYSPRHSARTSPSGDSTE